MNIVVADSGSTKVDWIIYNSGHTQRVTTPESTQPLAVG